MKTVHVMGLVCAGAVMAAGLSVFGQDAANPAVMAPKPAAAAEKEPTGKPLWTEDFESGELDKKVWEERTMGMVTIKVQKDKVAHGKSALAVTYPQGGARSFAFIANPHLPEAVKDHLFGRAYIYVDAPALPANHSVFLLAGTKGFPISNFLEIGQSRSKFQPSFQQNGADVPRGETTKSGSNFPIGKWACLEWEFNDKPDEITIWVDGKQTDKFAVPFKGVNEGLVKGFSELSLGFRCWGTTATPITIYYDDVAVSTERMGMIKGDVGK